ncbi:LCP family protein [Anaerosacchariphilus polymeriproducens]|uniref:LytR family transcriptional regulator n=1 Tax=Anaerosacchariphilus polymeriproducens TaxID=1812858 RepID=A0A371ARE1_9FIRM|nr:LCP family protein [Anaerosacchariphilus polymeriproducens]RDU22145.1 LytR family transcriptional regulator [Anaerosacchariphilus polymeriproducens]
MASSKQAKNKRKKARRKRRIVIFIIEIVIVIILLVVLYLWQLFSRMQDPDFNKNAVHKNEEVEKTQGFRTIALFGLDSRENDSLGKDNHSDTIIIASINNKTKEVKLASVYRDTYVKIPEDDYNKANSAYFLGGPEKAISMLNMNLDLVIDEYVTVNFMALVDVIDELGGIEINVTESEIQHLNNYLVENRKITGKDTPDVASTGLQNLNGMQATAYCRIRYTGGDDYRRTERQRLVISKIFEKVKKSDPVTLTKIANSVIGENMVNTNISQTEILKLLTDAPSYKFGETTGFPYTKIADKKVTGLDDVVACGFAYNVKKLHKFLYGEENYPVSSTVQEISDYIMNKTGVETEEMEEDTTPDTLTEGAATQ